MTAVLPQIVLCTLNARYIHASLGLRYIKANMGALSDTTCISEFTLENRAEDIVEKLLLQNPRVVGFGVYIWNAVETLAVVRLLKQIQPELVVALGGPEVSFEMEQQEICSLADYVLPGQSELTFAELCQQVIAGDLPARKIQSSLPLALTDLQMPYQEYTDEDIANRVIYVEASRGCPFKCEFCLSSLDKTATPFPLDKFIAELQTLMDRGARHFKFVDRTFNLKVDTCLSILDFFLEHLDKGLFLHFELIPDRLPPRLKEKLPAFPPGVLQFEIGIQSFNPEVQELVSRRQDMQKTRDNMKWLRANTDAHIHADLIFGLPGEDLDSFSDGFDALCALDPQEIQVGLLKRLRGTPIDRHTIPFAMKYQQVPPYRIMQSSLVDFQTMQRMARFARYWDLVANSGRFSHSLPLLLGDSPFKHFMAFSDWLHRETGQTHKIALARLLKLFYLGAPIANPALAEPYSMENLPDNDLDSSVVKEADPHFKQVKNELHTALLADFDRSGLKGRPPFPGFVNSTKGSRATVPPIAATDSPHRKRSVEQNNSEARPIIGQRQQRHLTN